MAEVLTAWGLRVICERCWARTSDPFLVRQSPPLQNRRVGGPIASPTSSDAPSLFLVDCRWFATFHGLTQPVEGLPSAKGEGTACLSERCKARTSEAC